MKKKLLSAMMAGMMVFGAGVQASATDSQTIHMTSTQKSQNANVTVEGTILNQDGQVPEGKIEVELPTAMAFTVDQDGGVSQTRYQINNRSKEGIKVSVSQFLDANGEAGINVIPATDLTAESAERTKVSLKLVGDNEVELGEFAEDQSKSAAELSTINAETTKVVTLRGAAGTQESDADTDGLTEQFTLVFKIERANG